MPHIPAASYPSSVWSGDTDNIDRRDRDVQAVPDPRDWDRIVSEVIAVQTELDSVKSGLGGGTPLQISTLTGNTTLSDGDEMVYVSCDDGDVTVILPTAGDNEGVTKIIKKIDSSASIVIVDGGTIDGDATKEIAYQWSSMQLVCDGSGWSIV